MQLPKMHINLLLLWGPKWGAAAELNKSGKLNCSPQDPKLSPRRVQIRAPEKADRTTEHNVTAVHQRKPLSRRR